MSYFHTRRRYQASPQHHSTHACTRTHAVCLVAASSIRGGSFPLDKTHRNLSLPHVHTWHTLLPAAVVSALIESERGLLAAHDDGLLVGRLAQGKGERDLPSHTHTHTHTHDRARTQTAPRQLARTKRHERPDTWLHGTKRHDTWLHGSMEALSKAHPKAPQSVARSIISSARARAAQVGGNSLPCCVLERAVRACALSRACVWALLTRAYSYPKQRKSTPPSRRRCLCAGRCRHRGRQP